jgi:hypothetical protein
LGIFAIGSSFWPFLASNHDPPYLCLLSSQAHRPELFTGAKLQIHF